MMLSDETDEDATPHPYWHARVVGIFHADVLLRSQDGKSYYRHRVDFLWVRWFGRVKGAVGLEKGRLPRCGFIDTDEEGLGPFGFVDPNDVIRAVHLLPVFGEGKTDEYTGKSVVRHGRELDADYVCYDVKM
jgi:hypothetical protein